jgi:hypothetical protein
VVLGFKEGTLLGEVLGLLKWKAWSWVMTQGRHSQQPWTKKHGMELGLLAVALGGRIELGSKGVTLCHQHHFFALIGVVLLLLLLVVVVVSLVVVLLLV